METAQPLHPESKALVELFAKLRSKGLTEQTVDEARDTSRRSMTHPAVAGVVNYDGTRTELFVPLTDFTGPYNIGFEMTATLDL